MPMLTNSSRKKVLANSLSAAVSNFENATTTVIMRNNLVSLADIETDDFPDKLKEFLQLEGTVTGADGNTYHLAHNGNAYCITTDLGEERDENTMLASGGNLTQKYADVIIDVNGENKPNQDGRDIFYFVLGTDGILYPVGGKDWAVYTGETANLNSCEDDMTKCAAYLLNNGYNMDY
jgi:hypothetical protein